MVRQSWCTQLSGLASGGSHGAHSCLAWHRADTFGCCVPDLWAILRIFLDDLRVLRWRSHERQSPLLLPGWPLPAAALPDLQGRWPAQPTFATIEAEGLAHSTQVSRGVLCVRHAARHAGRACHQRTWPGCPPDCRSSSRVRRAGVSALPGQQRAQLQHWRLDPLQVIQLCSVHAKGRGPPFAQGSQEVELTGARQWRLQQAVRGRMCNPRSEASNNICHRQVSTWRDWLVWRLVCCLGLFPCLIYHRWGW